MSVPAVFGRLTSDWRGESFLWLAPGQAPHMCIMQGTLSLAGNQQFASFAYTWSYEGAAQDGVCCSPSAKTSVRRRPPGPTPGTRWKGS